MLVIIKRALVIVVALFSVNSSFSQTWTQKSNFPGTSRLNSIGVATDSLGYIFSGRDIHSGSANYYGDLWEYNSINDTWTQKAGIPAVGRTGAVGFSFDSLLFFGLGYNGTSYLSDFYIYNQNSNSWTAKAFYPGSGRRSTMYGVCQGLGFVAGGLSSATGYSNELWRYDPINDNWLQILGFPLGNRNSGTSFTIDSLIYFGLGHVGNTNYKDFWSYNPNLNSWSRIADLPGPSRKGAFAVVIDGKAIVGGGQVHGVGTIFNDYYEYDPSSNSWTQVNGFVDGKRSWAGTFSVNNVGYITGGRDTLNGAVNNSWSVKYVSTNQDELSQLKSKNVLVFPIPTKEMLNIVISSFKLNENVVIQIYSIKGKLLMEKELRNSKTVVNVRDLSPGVYIYNINSSNNQSQTGKFIID